VQEASKYIYGQTLPIGTLAVWHRQGDAAGGEFIEGTQ